MKKTISTLTIMYLFVHSIFAQENLPPKKRNVISTSLYESYFLIANLQYEREIANRWAVTVGLSKMFSPKSNEKTKDNNFDLMARMYLKKHQKGFYTTIGYKYYQLSTYERYRINYLDSLNQDGSVAKSTLSFEEVYYPRKKFGLETNKSLVKNHRINLGFGFKDTFGKKEQWVLDCNLQWASNPWEKIVQTYDYGYFTDENTGAKFRVSATKYHKVIADENSLKAFVGRPNFKISIGYRF